MKIAFTSCIRYEAFKKQPEWNLISKQDPDYLFLLGDTIYMDYGPKFFSKEPDGIPKTYSPKYFSEVMEKKYNNQFYLVPEFKKLVEHMKNKNGFFAIWDDHDFAWNNAKGKNIPKEIINISRSLFHKYTNCSTNQPHIFYHVDTPLARVIFIDNRTDADYSGKYNHIISKKQFDFIEEKLQHNLDYTLLCGGLTLTEGGENWFKYELQFIKLCQLLQNKKNVLFLGGDIHRNAFIPPKTINRLNITTPLQLISSGMQAGLGFPFDLERHNWAILELEKKAVKVSFYDKNGFQCKKSEKANQWIKNNFFK